MSISITYNPSGATGGYAPVDLLSPYAVGAQVVVLGNIGGLVRAGYKWVGWGPNNPASTSIRQEGYTFSATANVIFYAMWEQVPTFVVTYVPSNPPETTLTGVVPYDPTQYVEGDNVTVLASDLAVKDYVFDGWRLTGGPLLQTGESFQMPAQHTTLYGEWTYNPPQIMNTPKTIQLEQTIRAAWDVVGLDSDQDVAWYHTRNGAQDDWPNINQKVVISVYNQPNTGKHEQQTRECVLVTEDLTVDVRLKADNYRQQGGNVDEMLQDRENIQDFLRNLLMQQQFTFTPQPVLEIGKTSFEKLEVPAEHRLKYSVRFLSVVTVQP